MRTWGAIVIAPNVTCSRPLTTEDFIPHESDATNLKKKIEIVSRNFNAIHRMEFFRLGRPMLSKFVGYGHNFSNMYILLANFGSESIVSSYQKCPCNSVCPSWMSKSSTCNSLFRLSSSTNVTTPRAFRVLYIRVNISLKIDLCFFMLSSHKTWNSSRSTVYWFSAHRHRCKFPFLLHKLEMNPFLVRLKCAIININESF